MNINENDFVVSDSQSKAISLLAQILKNNGDRVLSGATKLSLTTSVLHVINEGFLHFFSEDLNESFSVERSLNVNNVIYENLLCLYDFVQKIIGLKITHGITTLQNNVNIANFRNLKVIEIKKVPIHMIVGLKELRKSLTTLICSRCLNKLQDLFGVCGADRAEPASWPSLTAAILSYNNLEELDDSLSLLPNLEILDLSYNSIRSTPYIECLSKIKCLNLSYNHLQTLPILNIQALSQLKILNLRNNNLEDLKELQLLVSIEELDLGYNCLIQHVQLSSLRCLKCLRVIWLDGNPLSFHTSHRLLTSQYLNRDVLTDKFLLDGKRLSRKELMHAKKYEPEVVYPTIPSGSSGLTASLESSYNSLSSGFYSRRKESLNSSQNGETIEDLTVSINSVGSIRRSRKKHRIREVEIEENLNVHVEKPATEPKNDNLGHLQTKNKIETFRKERGSNWLVASTRSDTDFPLPKTSREITEVSCNVDEAETTSDSPANIGISDSHNFDDTADGKEINALKKVQKSKPECTKNDWYEQNAYLQYDEPYDTGFGDSNYEANESDEETYSINDNVQLHEHSFFVDLHYNGQEANLIVSIQGDKLKEKDIITGKVLECLDVKCLLSLEKLSHLPYGLKLTFDYVKKDRRERIYGLGDDESCQDFMSLLQPVLEERMLDEISKGALQCLECNAEFSKDGAKLVLQRSTGKDISADGKTKDVLKEVNACPFCNSKMIIELDEIPVPKSDKIPLIKKNSLSSTPDTLRRSSINTTTKTNNKPRNEDTMTNKSIHTITEKKKQQPSVSLPGTPQTDRRTRFLMEMQQNRGQQERKYRSELFSNEISRLIKQNSSRSLESSPLSTSPSSQKMNYSDIYPYNEVREESVARIEEDSTEQTNLINSCDVAFKPNDSNFFSFAQQEKQVNMNQSIPKYTESFRTLNEQDEKRLFERRISNSAENPVMRRSESDITILSTQSSISVLSASSGEGTQIGAVDDCKNFDSPFTIESRTDSRTSNSTVTESLSSTVERNFDDGTSSSSPRGESTPVLRTSASNDSIFDSVGTLKSTDSTYHSIDNYETDDAEVKFENTEYHSAVFDSQNEVEDEFVQSHTVRYSYNDFSQIDHKIRLHLDMNLFECGEVFKLILKASLTSSKVNDVSCLLIVSNKNIYIMKITNDEILEPAKWLQKVDVKLVSQVKSIRPHLNNQGFFIEFDKHNKPNYLFILRDTERCKQFIQQLLEVIESECGTVPVVENCCNDLEKNLNIALHDKCQPLDSGDETYILLYAMGFLEKTDKGRSSFEPVSLVVTKNCILALTENYQFHLNSKNGSAFQVRDHQKIIDLTAVLLTSNRGEAKLSFYDEDLRQEFEWLIRMETDRSLRSLIKAAQEPWRQLFSIDLPIETC